MHELGLKTSCSRGSSETPKGARPLGFTNPGKVEPEKSSWDRAVKRQGKSGDDGDGSKTPNLGAAN